MANRSEIEATYNYMDEYWRLSLGDDADISCAMYDGDYSKTLEDAQAQKHDYILAQIRFQTGFRVVDIGCGWGGFLRVVRQQGGSGVGLTLSRRQAEAGRRAGLDVSIRDWKETDHESYGAFDAVVCVGAFEHFCSEEEYRRGLQDQIYHRFFEVCHSVLRDGCRMYLQTMTWGDRVPNPEEITLAAPKNSDAYIMALLRKFFPGSWLPTGIGQIGRTAEPWFQIATTNNGRLDYIQTMTEWRRRLQRFSPRKLLAAIKATRYFLIDRDFRYRLETVKGKYHLKCFERRIMDHQRIVLDRQAGNQWNGTQVLW